MMYGQTVVFQNTEQDRESDSESNRVEIHVFSIPSATELTWKTLSAHPIDHIYELEL
jgi:hypothetical protein